MPYAALFYLFLFFVNFCGRLKSVLSEVLVLVLHEVGRAVSAKPLPCVPPLLPCSSRRRITRRYYAPCDYDSVVFLRRVFLEPPERKRFAPQDL